VAGTFYPADPNELRAQIKGFLAEERSCAKANPKAIIVPHAGTIYSGPVAASAYACIRPARIERVVLMGPSHHVPLRGLATPELPMWATPLGEIMIDFQSLETILAFPQVTSSNAAHATEHCLEVQLPFLQTVLDDFRLVPLVVGSAEKEEVADVLAALWGGPETLVVISSDLSHYEPYRQAVKKDRATSKAITDLDPHGLEADDACGRAPIVGLLHLARQKGMRTKLLDLRNSGDTSGPKDRVVGYGAYAFYE